MPTNRERRHAARVASDALAKAQISADLDRAIALSAAKPSRDPFKVELNDLHPPGCVPKEGLAQDSSATSIGTVAAWASWSYMALSTHEGQVWLGWAYLAELAQRPEYRKMAQTIATEMTRRWIKIKAKGQEDKSEAIAKVTEGFEKLKVRDRFRQAAEVDGYFGGAHIYIDLGTTEPGELDKPIGNGIDEASRQKIAKGSLKALRVIEPIWVYPQGYNTSDPLSDDWYRPQFWNVFGRNIHRTRLLTLIGRQVPDLLKPTYSFRGLSLSQIAKPYVDNWLRARQSVSDTMHKFATSGVKIDLTDALAAGGGEQLMKRVQLLKNLRDNNGILVLKKTATSEEEFFTVSTPLAGLDALQAQAQEQLGSVSNIPLVKLLGISPVGLNASSEGEIRVFYDWIHAYQEHLFSEPLDAIFAMVQLSVLGEVDPDLVYEFEPLWSLDEKERAEVEKMRAEMDIGYVESNVLSQEEVRTRISADPETPYPGIKPDDLPPMPDPIDAPPGPDAGPGQDEQDA